MWSSKKRCWLNVYSNGTQNWTDLIRILMVIILRGEYRKDEGLLGEKKNQKAKSGEERTKKGHFLTSLCSFFKDQLLSCPQWEKNILPLNSRIILRLLWFILYLVDYSFGVISRRKPSQLTDLKSCPLIVIDRESI